MLYAIAPHIASNLFQHNIYKKDVGATTFAHSTYYGSRIAL